MSYNLRGKKVLVTGAGGFIGSHLTEQLIEHGAEVSAMVYYNPMGRWEWLEHSYVKNDIKVYYGKQELKNDPKTGWMLDKSTLILGRNLDVEFETDAKIFVKATPVRIENYNNGRAKPAF